MKKQGRPFFSSVKTYPTHAELAALDRDLQFSPCTNTEPAVLNRAQIEQFNEHGYLHGLPIFDRGQADELRQYCDEILAAEMARGGTSYSLASAHRKHGRIYDLQRHPAIVAIIRDLVGADVIAWGAHFFCKLAGDGKTVAWHQDASYWPLTPSKTVTVWLAVDDVDVENGCMQFMAGSHRFGHLDFYESDESEQNVLDQTVDDPEQYGTPVNIELQAGEISIHTDMLLHSSAVNRSERRRCGLTMRYCTPDVSGNFSWTAEGGVVSGQDRFGNWDDPPRPDVE